MKEGNATNTNITAGVIVQIISIVVPCVKYLCDITLLPLLNSKSVVINIQSVPTIMNDIYIIT